MIWFLLAFAAVCALAPLVGADTRDGRDWRADAPFPPRPRSRRPAAGGSPVPSRADRGRPTEWAVTRAPLHRPCGPARPAH